METGFKMFLLAAEEMNFSRAADRAFVTQQCFSDHIRRLEERYNIVLFHRKPKLQLTPEGTAMLHYISRIQALEESMVNELSDISTGVRGTINFGTSSTRGYIIIPQFIPLFQEKFPNVDVQVHLSDTKELEPQLINSKIDVLLGIDANQHALFKRIPICDDPLYLIISDLLLQTHFPNIETDALIIWAATGVSIERFQEVPFVQGHNSSTTTYAINQFLMKYNLKLRIPISVSSFDILMELCRTGRYATITPHFHLHQVLQMNLSLPKERQMHVFPIKNLEKKLSIEILTHRDARPPQHTSVFIDMLKEFLLNEDKKIKSYLQTK